MSCPGCRICKPGPNEPPRDWALKAAEKAAEQWKRERIERDRDLWLADLESER